tara:strand:+ start:1788 stop:3014 length:1227 start_codon:yes stop_codon:yes gene_type:complete
MTLLVPPLSFKGDSLKFGFAVPWLAIGILWFLAAGGFVSSDKVYRQGLIFLYWLPVVLLLASNRSWLPVLWQATKPLSLGLLLFICWAAVTLLWSSDDDAVRQLRRALYVALFLLGFCCLCLKAPNKLDMLMQIAGYALALSCCIALINQYVYQGQPLTYRAGGWGRLHHPIIGGYVIGAAMLWLSCWKPTTTPRRVCWYLSLLIMLTLILLTQSRGLWIALFATQFLITVMRGGRAAWGFLLVLGVLAIIGYFQFESLVTIRGWSYRPEIFVASLHMIADNLWGGIGLGSYYEIYVAGQPYAHSHNLFIHIAVELGLIGLLIWLLIWSWTLYVAWTQRDSLIGQALLKIILFSSVALMFDGGVLLVSPRPEWLVTWMPVGLALGLQVKSYVTVMASRSEARLGDETS